jgi:anthranilate phosphoribosyltransferase
MTSMNDQIALAETPLAPRVPTDTHDFAPYVRILGRGPGKSRSLTRAEARHALGMVLRGEATREQIGAMLMLLRYRGEAPEEMAGLVEAARDHSGLPWKFSAPVDLDWPSYADGRTRGLPWYLLSALLLAKSARRVVMHGPVSGPGRQSLVKCLALLGIGHAQNNAEAEASLVATNFAFVPTEAANPELAELLALRGVLGLRSPLNTVGRLLDPAGARASIDGVFHPAYIELHLAVAALLGHSVAVLKGGGGEAEWSGVKSLILATSAGEKIWPSLGTDGKPASVAPADLVAVWRGESSDPAGEDAVVATAAAALHAITLADASLCIAEARALWAGRNAGG